MISKLARLNSCITRSIYYPVHCHFATAQKLLQATKVLVAMNSQQLDQLCRNTLDKYQIKTNIIKKQKHKNHPPTKKPHLKDKDQTEWINADQSENSKQQFIKFLYETVSKPKIGYLKGDIHSQFVFKLNKYLSEKQKKDLTKQVRTEELKRIFNQITESKTYRIPKAGIKKSSDQDPANLYQRQLILEKVSDEQSVNKYENVLDCLNKLGKTHLTGAFTQYMADWFPPLCQAIREEQNKCKDQSQLKGDRKKYAQAFLKLSPQKLATLCLSELLKQVTAILYKDFLRQKKEIDMFDDQQPQPQYQQYDSIRYNTLCINFATWASIQEHYEQQERKFKIAMKEYDSLKQSRKKKKRQNKLQVEDFIRQKAEQKNMQKISHEQEDEEEDSQHQLQSPFIDPESNTSIPHVAEPIMSQKQVKQKVQQQQYMEKFKQIKAVYGFKYVPPDERKQFLLDLGTKFMKQHYKYKTTISEQVQQQIGKAIIYLMKEIIKIKNSTGYKVPLLHLEHKYFKKNGDFKYDKRLKVNQHFLNTILPVIEKQGDMFMHIDRCVPTIIQPLPWVEYEIGGYYLNPSCIMRFSQCRLQERLIRYSDLKNIFNVLDYLGKISWKINKRVLAVVQAIWIQGGGIGQIPKRYSQMICPYLVKAKAEKNHFALKKIANKIQKLRDEHSLRSDFNLKLNLAQSYSKVQRFYYPHNLDFRGRVYPVPPHLNHIGNDLSRGLLHFADGVKLGESGLRWLKIHCANLMGKDKATLLEKIQFTQSNLGLIQAIAQDPLKNRQWIHYEDCWQALAAIFELDTALKQKNPEEYVSYLHIHQDGSCNGLQHYAALGRDIEGAYQVNLGPTQRPGDVYTHVAKMVIAMVDQDVANPKSINHELAKKLNGQIKRKTIKQTVMTSVYGVTFIGARQQIHRQIKDQHFLKDDEQQYAASIYLAKYTLSAISNLFSSAHMIKKWLIGCAKSIGEQGNPVGWITPMGLAVVQPYRKQTRLDQVSTVVQQLKLSRRSINLPVNKQKQQSAFPPNFVHSLDSTHMMYTAQRCMVQGMTFAAVHDSYWTHAGNIDKMNVLLRQEFIRLHSQPLLQNLKASFEKRYPTINFPNVPSRGKFDLTRVLESCYFFS